MATERKLRHLAEAAVANGVFFTVRLMPFSWASALGGWIGRVLGPRLSVSDRARRNLHNAFPEKQDREIEAIVFEMWDNLGRTVFEFPHLAKLKCFDPGGPIEVVGAEIVDMLAEDGKPGIFFSAHLANWETVPLSGAQRGLPVHLIYRAPNNPLMESLFSHRSPGAGGLIAKGAAGARQALALLKDGGHLGILADQKMNDGIPVPFFGRDAMTAPALAQFALKFHCPVVPVRVERLGGAKLRITYYPALDIETTGERRADVAHLMGRVNAIIEGWVRERPGQWLWLHNRWPD